MTKILSGIRVVEVASWTFVPAAGAVLADLGADVLKIEHPDAPDPQRGFVGTGYENAKVNKSFMMEMTNRGKRSVAINIATEDGRELLYRLVETADVFLTNFLPAARKKLHIDVADIRARNPRIVYARGSGYGPKGADADAAGYDGTAYLARGSVAHSLKAPGEEWPLAGTAAVGDLPGAMTIAGSILGGLYHRERTGEAPVVDVSLLSVAMWAMAPGIVATAMLGLDDMPRPRREENANPISIYYQSADRRFVKLSMFESDRFFAPLCEALGAAEVAQDPRFSSSKARSEHRAECVAALDEVFGRYPLEELAKRLGSQKGAWGVVQTPLEMHDDPQAEANGYFGDVRDEEGNEYRLVGSPVQYDEEPTGELRPGPDHGQHTDEVLAELGLDWDTIVAHKVSGAIL
ncbi:MAG: CoA transferase [Acidimicrobiales bacterium]|nr:CoA transferase [Acidimicrobiales bacterium]